MAASSSSDARGPLPAERFRLLRELGARVVPAWAALEMLPGPEARTRLVVLERVTRGGEYGDQDVADWVRDARRLATLEHPNVARVRDVVIRGDEVLVVSDYVDGVRWSELATAAQRPTLEVATRVLVDVLSGLSAVHNLRDAKREPLKLVHGELTPECVIVGLDGVARIVSTCRPRTAVARPGRSGSAYLAPEVLLADESADARADVYSVGVMLWEALSGKLLFPNAQPSAIVTQLLSGRVARATVPEGAQWAQPLVDVATRALSADPEKRFSSAAALAADLRRIAATKLAPPVRVAAFIRGAHGDRIAARRAELESGDVAPREKREVSGVDTQPVEDVPVEFVDRASSVPTPLPPSLVSTRPPPPIEPVPAPAPAVPAPAAPPVPPPPPVVASRAPPVPRQPPPMRPRAPTLAGVAPPPQIDVELESTGTPVVVPSSSRPPPPGVSVPTPLVAFVPPPEAKVPLDLAPPVPAAPVIPAAPAAPPPAPPSPPPMATPIADDALEAAVPAKRRSRALTIALVSGPVAFVLALIVWWLASGSSRGEGPSAGPSAQTGGPVVAVPAPPPSQPAATSEPQVASPPATATTSPTPSTPAEPAPSPEGVVRSPAPATPTEVARPPSPTAAPPTPTFVAPAPPPAPTPAPPHTGRRKYEPEGI